MQWIFSWVIFTGINGNQQHKLLVHQWDFCELSCFSKELHGAECPSWWVSLSFQQLLFSAYGPAHTLLSALIESKTRFCSNPCFKGREDHTVWKPVEKGVSSAWFTMQLLETWDLFSLASQAGFLVRLDVVLSSGAQESVGCAKVLIAVEKCQHGVANEMAPLLALLLASCLLGITSLFSKDAVKFPWYTLAYTEGLAPEPGQCPKSLKTLKSASNSFWAHETLCSFAREPLHFWGRCFIVWMKPSPLMPVLVSRIRLKIKFYSIWLSSQLFTRNRG